MGLLRSMGSVAVGGALGTLLRYGINAWTGFTDIPIGTVTENLVGSLLLGLLTGWLVHRNPVEWVRAGVGVGFCGGFTTMSTLASDLVFLTEQISPGHAAAYLFVSLMGGVGLAWGGYALGAKLGGRRTEEDTWTS